MQLEKLKNSLNSISCVLSFYCDLIVGGNETRSGYVRYIQGIQPNVPACTRFIDIYKPVQVNVINRILKHKNKTGYSRESCSEASIACLPLNIEILDLLTFHKF